MASEREKAGTGPGGRISLNLDDGRGQVGEENDFRSLLEGQKAVFQAKFGRDFRPSDPLFFDPEADTPVLIEREKLPPEVAEVFARANIHGALIYAQVKVGFFISPMNFMLATEEQTDAWDEAIREFAYLKGIR